MSGEGWHREGFLALKRAGAPSRPRPRLSRVVTPCPPCAPAPLQLPGQGVLRPTPPPHTAGGGRAAPSSCPSCCPPACLPEPPEPALPLPARERVLGSAPVLLEPGPAAQGMAEGTEPCSSGDGTGDSTEHWDHPVSCPTLEPLPAVHRNGNVEMLQVLALCPWGGTWLWPLCSQWAGGSSGCGQGVPVLAGTVSTSRWLSRGAHSLWEMPNAAASWVPLCPLPGRGDQTSPGMRVPSG